MFLKDNCSGVIEEDSMSLTVSDIVQAWEFVIFTHFLVTTHIFQPVFPVVYDLKRIGLISCIIDQTVDSASHFLILHGHRFWMFGQLQLTTPDTFTFIIYQP